MNMKLPWWKRHFIGLLCLVYVLAAIVVIEVMSVQAEQLIVGLRGLYTLIGGYVSSLFLISAGISCLWQIGND